MWLKQNEPGRAEAGDLQRETGKQQMTEAVLTMVSSWILFQVLWQAISRVRQGSDRIRSVFLKASFWLLVANRLLRRQE